MTFGIEEKYRDILNNIEELYYEVDLAGNLTFLNGSMTKILGYSMEEMIGMNNRQYMSPETSKKVYQAFNQVYQTGIPTKAFDWELIRKDGTSRVLETSVSLMQDAEGKPVGFFGIGRDITERKLAEMELKENEEKYRNILSNIEELYYEVDLAGNLTFLNGSMTKILGYSMEELIGMNNRQYMSPETSKKVYQAFNQVYRTGIPTKAFDWELIRKDGTIRVLETSVSLMHDPKGQPIGFYGIGRDITERKQLEERERRLQRAKDKALHQLSHELHTPLSIALGITHIFKKKIQFSELHPEEGELLAVLENHLRRLLEIQRKCIHIIQYSQNPDEIPMDQEPDQHRRQPEKSSGKSPHHTSLMKDWIDKMDRSLSLGHKGFRTVDLSPLLQHVLARTKENASHRKILFLTEGEENLRLLTDPGVIEEIVEGLLKNAIENTPDEGKIRISMEASREMGFLKVKDFGIGITEENRKSIFEGLFAAREMELYSSKKPYDFYAGGKGLDLFKMKVYGEHYGFDISANSRRCIYLPTDHDLCPGRISLCPHCKETQHCYSSGGSTFYLSFPISKKVNGEPVT